MGVKQGVGDKQGMGKGEQGPGTGQVSVARLVVKS